MPDARRPIAHVAAHVAALAFLAFAASCGEDRDAGVPSTAGDPNPNPPAAADSVVGRAPPATAEGVSLVALYPLDAPTPPVPAEPLIVDQSGIAFLPARVAVQVGRTVHFANSDPVTHNVRIVPRGGGAALLDVDIDVGGAPASFVVERVGAWDVLCNTHPGMDGLLFGVETPWATAAGRDGRWTLVGVPPGRYRLEVTPPGGPALPAAEVEVRPGRTEVAAAN